MPEDLSIIGIGDFKGSGEIEPSLTTIRIPAKRIGSQAAELMADAIAGSFSDIIARKFELRVIPRQSTAPPGP